MRKFFVLAAVLSVFPGQSLANPACAVCTIAIGASLEIARNLGVEDAVVGLWAGALLTLLGYWTIVLFDKKKWYFAGRNFWLIFISVSMLGFVSVSYTHLTQMKALNGGHAHFPFEKVVLPLGLLLGFSLYFTYYPI